MVQNGARSRRIRVVHVNVSLNIGGAEKLLVEFARHADREQFELRFVTLGQRGALADDIDACGWPVTALEEPEGLRKWLVFRLAWHFRRGRADVVHTHNTKALFYGAPAARLVGVPAVLHTRHGQRFQSTRADDAVFRFLSRFADRVVCVSRDGARLSAQEGIAPRRIDTIWNGIDLEQFAYVGPQASGPAVMVGRLSAEKDVATLIHATALVIRELPTFQLHIAGDGDCLPNLRRLVSDLGIGNAVQFLGEIRTIPELLSRCSMMVMSSLTEGISLTLLEAMARGLPVVATRVGGNAEVVDDGKTGFLVPPQQPGHLAERVVYLLRRPDVLIAMGCRARERVEAHFQVATMVARYEALYRQLLGRRHASPLPNQRFSQPDPSKQRRLQPRAGHRSGPSA
jgi:glycosyltransferase involved in cell wall biosynthesis